MIMGVVSINSISTTGKIAKFMNTEAEEAKVGLDEVHVLPSPGAPSSPAQTPPPPSPPSPSTSPKPPPAPPSASGSGNSDVVKGYGQYIEEVEALLDTPDILFSKTASGMFRGGYNEETIANIKAIRELHETYPEDRPKACAFMLAYPTWCGDACVRGNKHEQSWNVMHNMAALEHQMWKSPNIDFHYPVVIYHEDYTDAQKRAVESASPNTKVFWFQIAFGAVALPEYISREDIDREIAPNHEPSAENPKGNIEVPHSRGKFHGFGYRCMCRFFGGLIFHSPLVREFDYYWRLDGGDSRLRWAEPVYDLFKDLKTKNLLYGFPNIKKTNESPLFDQTLAKFEPKAQGASKLMSRFFTNGKYNGYYYYNNFEVVHVPTFHSKHHWEIFATCDRSGAFFFGPDKQNGLGDADFRSGVLGYLEEMSPQKIHEYSDIGYNHPISWNDDYLPKWIGDFKWEGPWVVDYY
ncbi:hypothetical protein TL16_g10909 [Triparma laevis f. inornata]|uniref:Uncharacterized protein n=2 Tax=Triparma laevis TaxID=1534972 RepID=A0A9W7F778_9STRA|nr:hypothetical protein TL16_g10909 [Triparma laevis f. inornata]GMI05904.1 hypothetical protein TrLO_g5614 [Triparma laevis f. longispina]